MEDNAFLLFILGFAGTVISLIFIVTKVLVGRKPLINLLEGYKNNPKFSDLQFEIVEDKKIKGTINDIDIELIPEYRKEGGIAFILIIDLSKKHIHNNHFNLENALGKQKFIQDGSKVKVNWEPKIFNYGKFDKIINKLQILIDTIENKRSYIKS